MKIEEIQKRHKEAQALRKRLDDIDRRQERLIQTWENSTSSSKQVGKRRILDNTFSKMNRELEIEEDKAYRDYYNHMHKDFNIKKSRINFMDPKYKNKFTDKDYVDDMYKDKLNKCKPSKGVKNEQKKKPVKKYSNRKNPSNKR